MKIHAHVTCPTRALDSDPTLFLVDYFFLTGPKRSATVKLMPANFGSEHQLIYKLKVLLAAALETTYAPEQFSPSDILFL